METLKFENPSNNSTDWSSYPFHVKQIRNKFRFVVKEHHATRIHYDFRLEFPGILKSWVIEKEGPTMKAETKRQVIMVSDHNPDFIYREGIIPKGSYGAGEMIVWDKGYYFPMGGGINKREDKDMLAAMMQSGELHFFIMGYKLKGEFRLIKTDFNEKSWKLIKISDTYCTDEDMTKLNKSVIDGKTIFDWRDAKNRQNSVNTFMF